MICCYLTSSFQKSLKKINSITESDLISLFKKYPNSRQIIELDRLNDSKILKCYLLSKKVRCLVLFQYVKNIFIPVSIVKKESKFGKNISKKNYENLFSHDIEKAINDVQSHNYKTININEI
ncbi:hypothetical protein COB57_05190 [Candidatus Peregrinibacteria bacterium]|nr:MAG: hypothetical protein COB57_05190 [Candidatus Peregrinibacteria bacterium]